MRTLGAGEGEIQVHEFSLANGMQVNRFSPRIRVW